MNPCKTRNEKRAARAGTAPKLAVLCVSLLTLVLPAAASASPNSICDLPEEERPQQLPEPVELCGLVALTGRSGASARVYLPEDATLLMEEPEGAVTIFGPDKDVHIEGGGAYTGFLLMSEGYLSGADGVRVFAGSLPEEFLSWDQWSFLERSEGVVRSVPGPTYTLSAGDYNIYLLTDDTPATVTLRLSGPIGDVELRPKTPVAFEAQILSPRIAPDPVKNLHSAGDTGELGEGWGMVGRAIWFNADTHVDTEYGSCSYAGEPPLQDAGYLPDCGGNVTSGSSHSFTSTPDSWSWGRLLTQAGSLVSPGPWSLGWWYESVSQIESVHTAAFWLTLD